MKKNYKKSGFTLIEMIMVIFLTGVILTMTTNLLFSIMKGTSKSEVEKEVKQNGDYALSFMERTIRNAKSITLCQADRLTIVNFDNTTTTFRCSVNEGVTKIASQSGSMATYSYLTSKNVTVPVPTNMPTCSLFDCADVSRQPPLLRISFTLEQPGTVVKPEDKASVLFTTSVSLRNY